MAYYEATIDVLVEANSEAEACDAIAEGLRPMLKHFEPKSSWIDWRYSTDPFSATGEGFEYAEAEN